MVSDFAGDVTSEIYAVLRYKLDADDVTEDSVVHDMGGVDDVLLVSVLRD